MTTNLDALSTEAREFVAAAYTDNTRRAYASDWADFTAWCDSHGRASLPAEPHTLADYLASLASPPRDLKASTIQRHCTAIAREHRLAGLETPLRGVALDTMTGIRRTLRAAGVTE